MEVAINKPKNAEDFEEMCKHIYSVVFIDPTPKHYGRKGQKQYGKDILIQMNNIQNHAGRIAIQCKHVQKLTFDDASGDSVIKEVSKAEDQTPPLNISRLIIATTLPADAALQVKVAELSDQRQSDGKFTVDIEFWNEIESHINHDQDGLLQRYKNDSKLPSAHLKNIQRALHNEKYENAFEFLQDAQNAFQLFDFKEKSRYYSYKSYMYFSKQEWQLALESINHAVDCNSKDEYLGIQVYLTLSLDLEKGSALLKQLKEECFDSAEILLNDYHELALKGKALPNFETLSPELKDQFLLKQIYLGYYLRRVEVKQFFKIYNYLTEQEKGTILVRCDYLNALTIQGFPTLIKPELEKLNERHLISWYLQQPKIEHYFGVVLILLHIRLGNREKAVELFKGLEKNCSDAIEEKCLHLMFGLVEDDQHLYQSLIQKYLSDKVTKTSSTLRPILSVIAHFKDVQSLNNLKKVCSDNEKVLIDAHLHAICQSPDNELLIQLNTLIDNQMEIGIILSLYCDVIFPYIIPSELLNESKEKILGYLNSLDLEAIEKYSNLVLDFHSKSYNYEKIYDILSKKNSIDNFYDFHLIIKTCFALGRYKEGKEFLYEVKKIAPNELTFFHLEVQLAIDLLDYELMGNLLGGIPPEKKSSKYWILDLIVAKREYSPQKYKRKINSVPPNLKGEIVDIFYIAHLEVYSGLIKKGLQRAFNLLRMNFNNAEAQQLYFELIVGENIHSCSLEEYLKTPGTVQKGTVVGYKDNQDKIKNLFIDFDNDLPSLENFKAPNDKLSKQVINKKVGDIFTISHNILNEVALEIIEIKSIYLAVFHLIQEKMSDPLEVVGNNVLSSSLLNDFDQLSPEDKQEKLKEAFQPIYEIMQKDNKQRLQYHEFYMEIYREHPLPISFIAKLFKQNICQLVYFWPFDYKTPMIISNPRNNEFADSVDSIVIDSISLCELARIDSLELLKNHKVFITTHTEDTLRRWNAEVNERVKNNNSLFFHDNGIPFISSATDKETHLNIQKNMTYILEFIDNNCEVVVAYGTKDHDFYKGYEVFCRKKYLLNKSMSILSDEELSILRLCKEKEEVTLLTIDHRFKSLVSDLFKLKSISLLSFLEIGYKNHQSSLVDKKVKLFFSNRFIELDKISVIECMLRSTANFRGFILTLRQYNTHREKNGDYFVDIINFYDCLVENFQQYPAIALAITYLCYIAEQKLLPKIPPDVMLTLKKNYKDIDLIKIENFSLQFGFAIPRIRFSALDVDQEAF